MAQYSMGAYDADVFIPEFRGLMQAGDQMGSDLRYSPDCMNIECVDGVLQPVPKYREALLMKSASTPFTGVREGTLMFLKDEIYGNASKNVMVGGMADARTIAGGGEQFWNVFLFAVKDVQTMKLYKLEYSGAPKGTNSYLLTEVSMPSGVTLTSVNFSWTTYEIQVISGVGPDMQPVYSPANVLILANKDGVFSYRNSTMAKLDTPETFSCVGRFAERIWGAHRDYIYYSRPFSCTDWTQDNDDPANGGGEIRLATFDDDPIVAMKPFGDSLIIFSKKRAWRLTGSDPSNFSIQEQYGNGCLYPDTIAIMDERIIMVGQEGLVAYDGYRVTPFLQSQTKELFRNVKIPFNIMKATRIGQRYILSFCGEASRDMVRTFDINESGSMTEEEVNIGTGYKMLVFDEANGSVTLRDSPSVISFCGNEPYALTRYFELDPSDPLIIMGNYLTRLTFDSWEEHSVATRPVRWVSPWITFNRQDVKKGGFELYFTPETEEIRNISHQYWERSEPMEDYQVFETQNVRQAVELKFTIQTEKKKKTKTYTVQPINPTETPDKKHKMKRLYFGGAGRRFRVIIEQAGGTVAPWRLIGGIHIIAEIDKD